MLQSWNTQLRQNTNKKWYNKDMDDKEKQEFKSLSEKVQELELIIKEMNSEKRNYTQKEVFTNRVVFRGSVYDKSGNKVIN